MSQEKTTPHEVIAEAVSRCKRDGIQDAEDYAARILAALVEAGFAVVPREPTEAMMDAGLYQSSPDATWADIHASWKDMVDAAVLAHA